MARLAWPSFSMKTVLAVQVALIFTALMWGVTWLIERRMLSATQAMVLEQQATLARNTAGQVRQQLLVRQRALLLAAPSLGALQPEPVAAQAMMDVQRGLLGAFDSVELVRAADQRVLARLPALAGHSGARLPPLDVVHQTLLSQRGMVSQPLPTAPGQQQRQLLFTAPVFDQQGQVQMFLLASIRVLHPDMFGWLPQTRIGKSGHFFLMGRDRLIIAGGGAAGASRSASDAATQAVLAGHDAGWRGRDGDGVDTIQGFQSMPEQGWVLAAVLPVDEAFAPVRGHIRGLRWLTASAALLCALLSWYLLSRRLQPATRLLRAMQASRDAPGQYQALAVERNDEISRLTSAYNLAMQATQQHLSAFHSASERLQRLNRLYDLLTSINHVVVREQRSEVLLAQVCAALVESGMFGVALALECLAQGELQVMAHAGPLTGDTQAVLPLARRARDIRACCFAQPTDGSAAWQGLTGGEPLLAAAALPLRQQGRVVAVLCLFSSSDFFDHEVRALLSALAEDISFALAFITEREARLAAEADLQQTAQGLEQRVTLRSAELEAANAELEAFSYTVSHDLRSPLRAIHGFASIFAETRHEALDQEAQQLLGRVLGCADNMGEMIDDLLQLAQVSRYSLRRAPVDIAAMAREILQRFAAADRSRQATLDIPDHMLVHGDPRMLRHIMENLLGNAWKFSAGREHAHIGLRLAQEQGRTVYIVEDNGVGFDMQQAGRLFEPFQRLHGRDEFAGNGIGLATVQRLVHRHGGSIRGDSEAGKGSRFIFDLAEEAGDRH